MITHISRGLLLALGLAGAAVPAAQAVPGVPAVDAQEIVETLLGLDPARHPNPLAAMKGWGALYGRYHQGAQSGDAVAMRVWLLMAHTATAKADAATSESYSTDLLPVFKAQPQALLGALADNTWLVPVVCFHLGRHFDFQGRGGAGRDAFIASEAATIKRSLPAAASARCLAQVKDPQRPVP